MTRRSQQEYTEVVRARQALDAQFLAVNPATLARDIGDTLTQLWQLGASRRPRPAAQLG